MARVRGMGKQQQQQQGYHHIKIKSFLQLSSVLDVIAEDDNRGYHMLLLSDKGIYIYI